MTISPGTVACPRCEHSGIVGQIYNNAGPDSKWTDCDQCDGTGRIPDPRIANWNSNVPARMVAALGGVEVNGERLERWAEECEKRLRERVENLNHDPISTLDFWTRLTTFRGGESCTVKMSEAASLLHCIFGPTPEQFRERVTCPECEGIGTTRYCDASGDMDDEPCKRCGGTFKPWNRGTGTVPAPLINPTWLTSTVCDLAKMVAGGSLILCETPKDGRCDNPDHNRYFLCDEFVDSGCLIKTFPDYSRTPILADALMDAGADDAALIEHLRQTTHCGECVVLKELIGR